MNKETIVTSAFRVYRSEFSCSLAAALFGKRSVSARQGWAGEKSGFFEPPAGMFRCCTRRAHFRSFCVPKWFFRSLLEPVISEG